MLLDVPSVDRCTLLVNGVGGVIIETEAYGRKRSDLIVLLSGDSALNESDVSACGACLCLPRFAISTISISYAERSDLGAQY